MKKALIVATAAVLSALSTSANADNSITVFAASSLTDSYTQVGKQFEEAHKGVKVNFSFQASTTLATQIKAGAPADIFISAEPFADGINYITNRVVLGVKKSSKITKISDLNGDYLWIQCAPEVPCGATADAALVGEGVTSKPVSLEPKVSSAVAKLVSGEVDAAIIYKSDVQANKALRAIQFKNQSTATTTYQIAQLRKNRWATTFMKYLQSKTVIKLLQSKGFGNK